jgi:hypothetical protein
MQDIVDSGENHSSMPGWRLRAAQILEWLHYPALIVAMAWLPVWAWQVPRPLDNPDQCWLWVVGAASLPVTTLILQLACRQCPVTFAAARLRGESCPTKGVVARLYRRFGPVVALPMIAVSLGTPVALLTAALFLL